uniref:SCP domain-containing protein n=3 Tax=Mesocestoides TaxID=53467 RepID=A0A5K3F1B9_MESCO
MSVRSSFPSNFLSLPLLHGIQLKTMKILVALLSVLWLGSVQCLTTDERDAALQYLTQLRENVQPPASNMMLLNYSVELEQIAERYLSRCPDNHPDPLVDTEFNGTTMTIKSYSPYKPSVLEYLQDYQSSLRFCDSQHRHFAFCQSHRKMVWAQSTEVGCAIHFCGPARHSNYLIGCLYKPGMNNPPDQTYTVGESCSQCPQGYSCYRKQCTKASA